MNMSDERQQLTEFFNKCNEMKKCKFIMATTKMKDILKSIVNSPALYDLFEFVTKDFNYPQSKAKCLVTVNDGKTEKSYLSLPENPMDRLALIFCLLVEFDRETMNFNDFLRRYFSQDGTYFTSYHAFCNGVIDSMAEVVAQVFEEEPNSPDSQPQNEQPAQAANPERANYISVIDLAVSEEKQFISISDKIPEEEKVGGQLLLTQLFEAVKAGNAATVNALVCGYNYFVLYHDCVSENLADLIKILEEYKNTL